MLEEGVVENTCPECGEPIYEETTYECLECGKGMCGNCLDSLEGFCSVCDGEDPPTIEED